MGITLQKNFSGTLKIYKIMKKRGSSPVWYSLQQLKIAIWTNLNQQKPDTAHVSDNKNRNMRRMIIIFVSADRDDPKDICKYRGYVVQPSRFFFEQLKVKALTRFCCLFRKIEEFWSNRNKIDSDPFWTTKKPNTAHVCRDKNRTKRRMTIPFVSASRYDP